MLEVGMSETKKFLAFIVFLCTTTIVGLCLMILMTVMLHVQMSTWPTWVTVGSALLGGCMGWLSQRVVKRWLFFAPYQTKVLATFAMIFDALFWYLVIITLVFSAPPM